MKSLQVLIADTTENSCFEPQREETTKLTMPINDASVYSEKIKPASAPLSGATKSNAQLELQLLLSNTSSSSSSGGGSGSSAKPNDSALIKHQGQKWQQIFDFEKMLKQIRVAEKQQLRGKGDSSSSNGKNSTSPSRSASLRCPCQQKQVKRLNGSDMQYYGIVPKQTALDVVVCNVCVGVYTKVGFNNHMMLQHPSAWSTVPNKVTTGPTGEPLNVHANDNSQDVSAAEIVGSPSDISGTMSTCSNASSTSSLSSTYVTNPSRHKSSKNGSTAGSSSGSSSGGRSRSKTKHHSSSPSIVHPSSVSSAGAEMSQTSSKSSKSKNSSTNLASAAVASASTALNTSSKDTNTSSGGGGGGAGTSESLQPIPVYSSSSNSSCSLPPTPKIINAVKTPEASRDHTFSPASLISLNDAKDKHAVDAISVVTSSKKKVKSPPFAVLESVDSSTSNSSSEYERTSSSGGTTASSSKSSNAASKTSTSATKKAHMSGKDLHRFDTQISELDQAVSSITCGHDNKINISNEVSSCMEGVVESSLAAKTSNTIDFKLQPLAEVRSDKMQMMAAPSVAAAAPMLPVPLFPPQQVVPQACGDEPMPHTYSDDNSISTLDEMLDSKFINELLNTAESEIHFDENELDTSSQQTYLQQQPATKRMRFDDGSTTMIQQPPTELSAEFAVFQQQQQLLQQQQQQYPHYSESNLEDIKIYNTDQQTSQTLDSQYQTQQQEQQQQITAIDAMQLQQLLYQQQTLATYSSGGLQTTASTMQDQQQQQFDQTGKQIIDLCAENDLQKPKHHLDGKLAEYTTLASINNTYEDNAGCDPVSAHFQIFNIPSLTDDTTEDDAMMVDNGATSTAQQYVLPSSEEHLIYEITANNQVAVMSQQRQQQVIAEFLTQAGYENVENINNSNTVANNSCWDDELLDFDYSLIDTVKSLSSSGGGSESKSIKSEQYSSSPASKYHDDFYFNVFIYSGIPRPLAINSFGLLKLPHAAATTFRKNLLTTRKANNSPITLSGGINGVVGSNVVAAGSRFANVNSKPTQNYFTALSGGNGSLANEFSIGSITITNSPNVSQHQQIGTYGSTQQKQQNSGGPIEITFNAANATNGTATSPGSVMHRARPKSNTGLSAFGTANCAAGGGITKNKSLTSVTTPVAVVTPLSRTSNARTNTLLPQNPKTIYVSSTANGGDRVKFVKRSLIAPRVDANKKSHFSSKQIAEMLSGGKSFLKQQSVDNTQDLDAATDEQFKLNRVNRFYERRQKLFNLAHNSRQCPQQQQQKHKLLKPHLLRTLSDCGINNKANNPNGSSDLMRVFV